MHTGTCTPAEDFPKNPGIVETTSRTWCVCVCACVCVCVCVCVNLCLFDGTSCFHLAETSSWTGKEVQWKASGVHSSASHSTQAQEEAANQAKAAQTKKVSIVWYRVEIFLISAHYHTITLLPLAFTLTFLSHAVEHWQRYMMPF